MTRYKLKKDTKTAKNETRDAVQLLYDVLNSGQKKKVLKEEKVKNMFDRYGVEYSE